MSRVLILGILFASVLMNPSWAQNKIALDTSDPPNLGGLEVTSQWDYSCTGGSSCSFTCGTGSASHVTRLSVYMGNMPVGNNQKNYALFYDFSTREHPQGSGFSVSTGINTLSCQVNGLTLDYSGPARGGRRANDATSSIPR